MGTINVSLSLSRFDFPSLSSELFSKKQSIKHVAIEITQQTIPFYVGIAMSDHTSAVFNHSCLKVPRHPVSNHPFPVCEQKQLNQLKNQARQLDDLTMKTKRSSSSENSTAKSFIEFIDSIPEYDDVNHLSNKEFYRRLENLKEKQKLYEERLRNEIRLDNKHTEWIDDYKILNGDGNKRRDFTNKPFCATPILNKSSNPLKRTEDVESIDSYDKDLVVFKPPSRRSVRIETPSEKLTPEVTPEPYLRPKSRADSKAMTRSCSSAAWDDLSVEDLRLDLGKDFGTESKSAPNSPTRGKGTVGWKDTITIPQPFQMTVR